MWPRYSYVSHPILHKLQKNRVPRLPQTRRKQCFPMQFLHFPTGTGGSCATVTPVQQLRCSMFLRRSAAVYLLSATYLPALPHSNRVRCVSLPRLQAEANCSADTNNLHSVWVVPEGRPTKPNPNLHSMPPNHLLRLPCPYRTRRFPLQSVPCC